MSWEAFEREIEWRVKRYGKKIVRCRECLNSEFWRRPIVLDDGTKLYGKCAFLDIWFDTPDPKVNCIWFDPARRRRGRKR